MVMFLTFSTIQKRWPMCKQIFCYPTANREIFVLCNFHCLLRFNFVMSEIKRIYELKQVVCLFYVELLSFCPSLLNLSDINKSCKWIMWVGIVKYLQWTITTIKWSWPDWPRLLTCCQGVNNSNNNMVVSMIWICCLS
jgi:hypothetical protein